MKKLVGILAMGAMLVAGSGAYAAIDNTPHDMTTVTTYTLCEICHVPHGASGSERLWRTTYTIGATGWDATITGTLCADACHGASPAISGTGAHNVSGTVYGAGAHQGTIANIATISAGRDATGASPWTDAHGFKYWPAGGQVAGWMECTTCHNVHDNAFRPFIRQSAAATGSVAGSVDALCEGCHDRDNAAPIGRGAANTRTANNGSAYSQHPTSNAYDGATNYTPDINLNAFPASMQESRGTTGRGTVSAATPLGGHLLDPGGATGPMGCATCHAVHGNEGPSITTDLLAVANALPVADLCEACHGGGATTNVGVGGDDHPIDVINGVGTPLANIAATTAYETNTAWPTSGVSPNQIAGCTSCHSAHYGAPNTSLNRDGDGGQPLGWCASCHNMDAAQPPAHHSNTGNLAASIVGCEDCHSATGPGSTASMRAHQGFAEITWAAGQAAFCNACHAGGGTAPFNGGAATPAGGVNPTTAYEPSLPSRWGVDRAPGGAVASSHRVGATNSGTVVNIRNASFFTEGGTSYFAKWGGAAASAGYGAQTAAPGGVATSTILCYSCHNIMGNIGLSTVASINVGGGGVVTPQSGYQNNLLLYPYRDDGQGVGTGGAGTGSAVGSTFCIGCHNGTAVAMATLLTANVANMPGGTHPIRASATDASTVSAAVDAGRAITILVTTAADGTTADQAAAPNLASYPLADRMDCDSCHRPHDGDAQSAEGTRDYTLEQAAAGNIDGICSQCHLVYGTPLAQ